MQILVHLFRLFLLTEIDITLSFDSVPPCNGGNDGSATVNPGWNTSLYVSAGLIVLVILMPGATTNYNIWFGTEDFIPVTVCQMRVGLG